VSPAQVFAANIVAELASYGSEFWVAPGARSQSLAIAAAQVPNQLHVRIDERSLGFSALGKAAFGELQVLITTSGTAVANLHPAVLEAHHSGIPLILLTADRPVELRGVGSNQTTNQVGIFSDAVIECIDVPAPTENDIFELPALAKKLVTHAVNLAVSKKQPIQLNLQFREPLSSSVPNATEILATLEPKHIQSNPTQITKLQLSEKAVVVAGAGSEDFADEIQSLDLPVLAEPSSGVRHLPNSVIGYRFVLDDALAKEIDQVIVYGKPTLSRPVIALLRSGVKVMVRPSRMGDFRIPESAEIIENIIESAGSSAWLDQWITKALELMPQADASLDRRSIVEQVWQLDESDVLVLGASQMIRVADYFAPKSKARVWANRGLAGIDGTIATATGIALANKGLTRALMGDLTFLHDVGSLVIDEADGELNLQVVVVNDNGGKIFDALEVKQTVDADVFSRVFRTGQQFKIDSLASAFGWKYALVASIAELENALKLTGRVIIEIQLAS
jgi:2-succinyl-5-enolpyruvyl-6-hydroxy-3-cyclohexene-1-carboxylate synthase